MIRAQQALHQILLIGIDEEPQEALLLKARILVEKFKADLSAAHQGVASTDFNRLLVSRELAKLRVPRSVQPSFDLRGSQIIRRPVRWARADVRTAARRLALKRLPRRRMPRAASRTAYPTCVPEAHRASQRGCYP
jgi:hypothetical protein